MDVVVGLGLLCVIKKILDGGRKCMNCNFFIP